jgi:hypothetical protein
MTAIRASRAKRRFRRFGAALGPLVLALVFWLTANSDARADLKLPPRPRGDPPIRILQVKSSDPACEPNCPQWISAEGVITPGAASAFAKTIADLRGRRLPILISSHGGSVRDALAMGQLIRSKGLAVAVARTLIANCPERARACPNARGRAIVGGATCASACQLVLAGGVERLVGPAPEVGVHQITTVMTETEGVEHLKKVVKLYEQDWIDEKVRDYMTAMGIGEPVMTLVRRTPAASIRWLSPLELSESHLATGALDASAPILATGLNGLNSHALAGDPPAPDVVTASVSGSLAALARSGAVTLEATFAYRRGGGVIGASLAARDSDRKTVADPSPDGWTLTLTAGGGEAGEWKAGGRAEARAMIPRERFCALARGGTLVAAPPEPPTRFDLAGEGGLGAIAAEACPSPP